MIGTHGRRGFKRLLLGSVAETVLHEAPCPVLTVSPHTEAASSDVVTFKRILCPIDFSPSALQALGFALDLARQAGGLVTLLHVVEWLAEDEPQPRHTSTLRNFEPIWSMTPSSVFAHSWPKSLGRGARSTT